ncbi:hypothetical protein DSO57_1021810 [Entomophthora muscae]|uniref:Uncharacterized protein n=1 Tax=Entomophthora muscae TaxID=34485 RepID=A0ACC2SS56_9FUNG|nr:hypothetical protein DSO57_1021810 [Entomophthora muscae]
MVAIPRPDAVGVATMFLLPVQWDVKLINWILVHKYQKIVRIFNSSSLETWAREQELNPDPRSPRAAGPVDQRTTRLRFSGIEPLQADAENVDPCSETGQTKEIIAPNG